MNLLLNVCKSHLGNLVHYSSETPPSDQKKLLKKLFNIILESQGESKNDVRIFYIMEEESGFAISMKAFYWKNITENAKVKINEIIILI